MRPVARPITRAVARAVPAVSGTASEPANLWGDVFTYHAHDNSSGRSSTDDEVGTKNLGPTIGYGLWAGGGVPANLNESFGTTTTASCHSQTDVIPGLDNYTGDFTVIQWIARVSDSASGVNPQAWTVANTAHTDLPIGSIHLASDHGSLPNRFGWVLENGSSYLWAPANSVKNVFHMYAVTYNATSGVCQMYTDGVAGSSVSRTLTFGTNLTMGNHTPSATHRCLNTTACAMTFKRALSAVDIAGHWNSGDGLDYLQT